jgi:hypothetical protein
MQKLTNYRVITVLLFFVFYFLKGVSQIPEINWEKQFPANSSNYFTDVIELPEGNFALLGAIEKSDKKDFDIWILKCNSKGDTLKTKVFENPGNDIPFRIIATGENGFIIAFINKSAETGLKTQLIAVDSDLTELWSAIEEKPSAILQTDITLDNSSNIWWLNTLADQDKKPLVSLSKLNNLGIKTAEYSINETIPATGYSLQLLHDGTLGVACQVQPEKGNPTIQVFRLNSDGKVLWKSLIPQTNKTLTPQCLCCSSDNSLLVGGFTGMCFNPDAPAEDQIFDYDYLLTKLDASGKVIWTKNYNREGSEKGTSIVVLPEGNIMATGKCETSYTGNIGPWLLFIDKNGKMLADKVYKFRFAQDQATRILYTSDGGILLIGPGFIETEHKLSGWIKKLNPLL